MKKLLFLFLIGFAFSSCLKKEEVVVPYTCQDCIELYEMQTMNYNNDTILSTRVDTLKFKNCGNYDYQKINGYFYEVIYEFDSLTNTYKMDSLGNFYIKGWTHKFFLNRSCK
jgi:hypothetical protein